MKTLSIANIKLKNPLILAPMVDVTDLPYRLLCRKSGASLAYTEMLYISQILHENEKTKMLMKSSIKDKPLGLQITGSDSKEFSSLIPYCKPYNLIDINCGCPSLRITGNQAGSYLLKNPSKITQMIEILKESKKPVTVKIRLGFKKNNALSVAKQVEKAGASALTVHARLATHGKSTPAQWSELKKISRHISIPLIGNGDIFKGEDAAHLLDYCQGVMIARGAIGDPLIFQRILKYLRTGRESEFDHKKNIALLSQYLKLASKHSCVDIKRIKFITPSFIKGFKGAAKIREKIVKLKTFPDIQNFVKTL